MGRLIDADKLKAQVEAHEIKYKFTPTDYQYGHNVGINKAVNDIEDAETVEAIPVDWIEKYIEEMDEIGFCPEAMHVSSMMSRWKEEQRK